jgi:60 kDa SS-A/Ro ribonucleoprotein
MSSYLTQHSSRRTSQAEPIPGSTQAPNRAGGYAWAVDDWTRLERFLILGSEGGSYYVGEHALTAENATAVRRCIEADGLRAVNMIVDVSKHGRAPKNDPAIFALAFAASAPDARASSDRYVPHQTRRAALDALPEVCRTGTHLFHFATFVEQHRGWGRGLRRAVGAWYQREDVDALAYQAVKYRQRDGWTHRDLLRLAHPKAPTEAHDALYSWITTGTALWDASAIVDAFVKAQASPGPRETAEIIAAHPGIPREALNPDHLKHKVVWDALLRAGMPMTALIRNLATMTRVGLLQPMSEATRLVVEQLGDGERLRKSRVHPLAVLVALTTYASGRSARGVGEWQAVGPIVDALDAAFYAAFGNVEPTDKRTMLALDVSSSMSLSDIAGMPGITPRIGSAAMALVTAAVEPSYMVAAFTSMQGSGMASLPITPRQRLDDVVRGVSGLPFGGTDCALPMLCAEHNGLEIDTFVIYTDSETWAGRVHPSQALERYRQRMGIPAKLVVVGMVSNGFTVADPNDSGMLDVVGFDTATPNVIAQFASA